MSEVTNPIIKVNLILIIKILPSIDAPIYSRAEQLSDYDDMLQAVAE